ncbi:hypothetical protein AMTR_s00050p00159730 [Amborella trichopoda]|uniref:Uncharacterized protein n=1 Tax=Amborella trichopoda TaxID=13333 RepID=W1PXD2_AMBTC|nr:hypothetical protein AMTR_s00050p00159730 [Amborella trichopoda]
MKLKALEANYACVKGKVFRRNSHLVSFSMAHVSELMTLMSTIDALSIEYSKKRVELEKWRWEYLANLVAFRELEGHMVEVRRLSVCRESVVAIIEGHERMNSHPLQDL